MRLTTRFGLVTVAVLALAGATCEDESITGTPGSTEGTGEEADPVTTGELQSIQFISADPEIIGLKGTGGAGLEETSTVTFKLVDDAGEPVGGRDVTFSLNTTVGGIALSSTSGTSNSEGLVATVVQSGTVATTVRVTAEVDGTDITTQSDKLIISTGIPDDDSVSLSVTCFSPEALTTDGVTEELTIRLADRYNNPVPDGTAVNFNTEGGKVGSSCTTTDGECSVTWTSQNPRPVDGRATIVSHTIGEESFNDANGNGVFDDGDTFTDIPEVFRDDNEDGVYTSTADGFFLDFNENQQYDSADGGFNGLLCQHSTDCSSTRTLGVSSSTIIVMASSDIFITGPAGPIDVSGGSQTITVNISDINGNAPPGDTSVSANTSNGEIVFTSPGNLPCSTSDSGLNWSVIVEADDTPDSGTLTIEAETPSGAGTAFYQVQIDD